MNEYTYFMLWNRDIKINICWWDHDTKNKSKKWHCTYRLYFTGTFIYMPEVENMANIIFTAQRLLSLNDPQKY